MARPLALAIVLGWASLVFVANAAKESADINPSVLLRLQQLEQSLAELRKENLELRSFVEAKDECHCDLTGLVKCKQLLNTLVQNLYF